MNFNEQPSAPGAGLMDDEREKDRVLSLACLKLLDTEPAQSFDNITRLASQMFSTPIALVSLVDSDRQWFKSRFGLDVQQTEREFSFCSHAIQQNEVFVIENALADPRFADNPLVVGEPYIRFYAGAPLILESGHALGSLCVIDRKPRQFGELERAQLTTLASFVMAQIELHRRASRQNEVTGLPNRAQMAEDFEGAMFSFPGESRGLLLIDAIGNQRLEETARAVGIEAVEEALRDVSSRLKTIIGSGHTLYHVAESRFALLMDGETREQRDAYSREVLARLEQPFNGAGVSMEPEVVAGLVAFHLTVQGCADALRKATSAMQEATARNEKYRWHEGKLDAAHTRAYRLMREIPTALSKGEFRLVYQPKFNVQAGRFTGVEALARWSHPLLGNVSPGEFIPLVEKTALIHRFTNWALEQSLSQVAKWRTAGLELTVAVNVSSRNLDQPGFVDSVVSICDAWEVPLRLLHVECTENAVLTSKETRDALLRLRALGAQVSLDDFGMGYSNLSCLRELPVQMLKIDQSLVRPMEADASARELVKSLVGLGHSLGFRMLAEGVETAYERDLLIAAGCDALQGYFLGRPMEAAQIIEFMANPPAVAN